MVNYYVEFDLDRGSDCETLKSQLAKLRRKWQNRANSATTLEARQDAEKKMQLIREASAILLVPAEREKYDKELDSNPVFSGQQEAQKEDAAPVEQSSLLDDAKAMDVVQEAYNAGRYNTVFAIAQDLINRRKATDQVYRLLALSYIETDNIPKAVMTMQDMIAEMPEDVEARYWAAFFDLRLLPNRAMEARKHIDWLLQSEEGASARVAALDVEYHIDTGDMELAEAKTESYKQTHGMNGAFTKGVSDAYRQHAESNWTSYGGDLYFDDKQSYESWNKYFQISLDIHPDKEMQELYQQNKKIVSGVTFVKGNVSGILLALVLGYIWARGGARNNDTFSLGLAFILAGIYIAVFSFPPKWMQHRAQYTGKLDMPYEVAKVLSGLVDTIVRGIVWLVKTFIRLVFSFIG